MKFLLPLFFVVALTVMINADFMIPPQLEPEAKALRADMEKVGVRFIGNMPDPTSMGNVTPELKTRADALKAKLVEACVAMPTMPGS